MSAARETLLDKTIAHVGANGLSDMSLRELAAAIGTSHRMLIYHFGSREGLVAAIVARIEEQQRAALETLADDATSPTELMRKQWEQLSDPRLRPFVLLFFEVLALALHRKPGTDGFLDQLTTPWLDLASDISSRLGVEATTDELRLGVAVVRGLLIEVLATAEVEGPTSSLNRFLEMWDHSRADEIATHAHPE
jgi:AcrR family transcriptional regulator